MNSQKPWTQYEDSILKKLRDQQDIQRWSTIAQKMAQDYNLKGRNGKQCKQRYKNVFDTNNQVLMWDYNQQQKLFMLHDQFGNKWAIIGQQLSNRSDNQVKNHFYTKFRKSLRKLNKVIKTHFKKQFKQLRQNLLNKIIEGTEDKFKIHPVYDQQLSNFCSQLKNELLMYSYDQVQYNPLMDIQNNRESLRYLIQSLTDFSKGYKRKPKRIRRASGQQIQLQQINNNSSVSEQIKMKSQNSIFSSEIGSDCQSQINQSEQNCEIQQNEQQMKQFNKRSLGMPNKIFGINFPLIKKQKINDVIILKSSGDLYQMQQEKDPNIQEQNQHKYLQIPNIQKLAGEKSWGIMEVQDQNQIQKLLKRDGLLQEQEQINSCIKINKIYSSASNFSSYSIQQLQENFFRDDSTLNMRIFTTGIGGKNSNQLSSSIQKSDKLFKSIERDKALFQSLQSRKSDKLFRSIGRQ